MISGFPRYSESFRDDPDKPLNVVSDNVAPISIPLDVCAKATGDAIANKRSTKYKQIRIEIPVAHHEIGRIPITKTA